MHEQSYATSLRNSKPNPIPSFETSMNSTESFSKNQFAGLNYSMVNTECLDSPFLDFDSFDETFSDFVECNQQDIDATFI